MLHLDAGFVFLISHSGSLQNHICQNVQLLLETKLLVPLFHYSQYGYDNMATSATKCGGKRGVFSQKCTGTG